MSWRRPCLRSKRDSSGPDATMREDRAMKSAVPHRAAPHRVAVLALPAVLPFELGIPGRLFRAATDSSGKPLYEVVTCSMDGGPVPTAEDFTVVVRHGPDAL